MMSTFATAARKASAIAALLVACAAGSAAALTTYTSGGVEVRGFYATSATQMYAAAYGGGLYASSNTGGSWTRIALPGNAHYLTAIGGKSNTLGIVGAEEGLFRTTNFSSFTQVLFEPVSAVAVSQTTTTVLAAVRGVGVLRSTDSGATFTLANNSGFDSLDIVALAINPANTNIVYAAAKPDGTGTHGGVYKSTDGGTTWSTSVNTNLEVPPAPFGATRPYVASLAVDSSGGVYAGILDINKQGDVWYSSNAGASWAKSQDIFGGIAALQQDRNNPATIWAGSTTLGLQKGSTTNFTYQFPNNGPNPSLLYTGVNAVGTFPGNANAVLWAVKGAGVWLTSNAGASWARVDFPGADRVRAATGVAGQPNTVLIGLHAGGVWKSTTGLGGPYNPPTVNGLVQADFSFSPAASGGVMPFTTIWDLSASASSANVIYAAAGGPSMFYGNDPTGIFRWDGSKWLGLGTTNVAGYNIINEGGFLQADEAFGVSVNPSNENDAWAGLLSGDPSKNLRHRSGATWTSVASAPVRKVVWSSNNATLLALVFGDKPQISTNSGGTFGPVTVSQTGFNFMRFFSAAQSPSSALTWIAGTNKGLFRSTDSGGSWTRVAMAGVFLDNAINAVGFRPSDNRAFAADFDGNRYCSTDAGATWHLLSGTLNAGVNAIRTIGTSLYYLTDGAGMVLEDSATCP